MDCARTEHLHRLPFCGWLRDSRCLLFPSQTDQSSIDSLGALPQAVMVSVVGLPLPYQTIPIVDNLHPKANLPLHTTEYILGNYVTEGSQSRSNLVYPVSILLSFFNLTGGGKVDNQALSGSASARTRTTESLYHIPWARLRLIDLLFSLPRLAPSIITHEALQCGLSVLGPVVISI